VYIKELIMKTYKYLIFATTKSGETVPVNKTNSKVNAKWIVKKAIAENPQFAKVEVVTPSN
jgi:hypothetical protein